MPVRPPLHPRVRRLRRRGSNAQSLVETTLVLPLFILVSIACIDAGRYAYVRATVVNSARATARSLSLYPGQTNDCNGLIAADNTPGAVSLSPDPNSLASTATFAPTAPGSIPGNAGYVYIFPAVSTATPQLNDTTTPASSTNCQGQTRASGTVTVQITYQFVPWTPVAGSLIPPLTITAYSQNPTEY